MSKSTGNRKFDRQVRREHDVAERRAEHEEHSLLNRHERRRIEKARREFGTFTFSL